MQLLRKNDARLKLHQPVRYQIVFPSCQPCLSDEIRLHLLYSLLNMWNVTVGPVDCRMGFYLSLYREDLIFVLRCMNIIFIASITPIRLSQYSESTVSLLLTKSINSGHQQRSRVCPVNTGFIVHLFS